MDLEKVNEIIQSIHGHEQLCVFGLNHPSWCAFVARIESKQDYIDAITKTQTNNFQSIPNHEITYFFCFQSILFHFCKYQNPFS